MKTIRIYLWNITVLLWTAIALSSSAQAETVNFWIGNSAGNPLTQINAPLNGEFDLSVWMTNDYQTKATEVLFGYDTTSSQGASAPKLDNKIGLVSVTYGTVANGMTSKHAYNWYGGDYKVTSTENRPGGYRLALDLPVAPPTALGPYATATKVFDIRLKNLAVGVGQEYYVELWNAHPSATSGSSFCTKAGTISRYQDLGPADPFNPAYGAGTGWSVKITNSGAPQQVSINGAKTAANDTPVILGGATVAAKFRNLSGPVGFSVEELGRSCGIRVISAVVVNPGDIVTVNGTIATVSGERVIDASSGTVTVNSSGNPIPAALGMANSRSGGGAYGAQGAVVDKAPSTMSVGASSIGLLIRTWGYVTASVNTGDYNGYFYIDDGSGLSDGSGNIGIKCRPAPGGAVPQTESYVVVTGVMGVQQIGGLNTRYLWTVSVE